MNDSERSMEADQQFDRSFKLLQQLVNFEDANELFAQRAHTVYTACVVLWMLVYQRLKPDASLENAVKHLIETRPSYLPENKRLDENTISTASGAYSRARSRLPLEVVRWFAEEVSSGII
ncbi:MAG: IS4 family transposase, partial [Rhodopirellula bahusiensis]